MRFIDRFLHQARADAHGVLDSLEDRGLVLRQCLREAELEVARKRERCAQLERALELRARQREPRAERMRALERDIRLALDGGEQELARFAVRRLLALRKHEAQAEARERDARDERERLAEKLTAQEAELETLRERVRAALAEASAARAPDTDDTAPDSACVRDEEVELELLRRRAESPEARS